MLLFGAIAWGLLLFGAIGHLWHHAQLRRLLAAHVDHEAPLALGLIGIELALVAATPLVLLADWAVGSVAVAIAFTVLGLGFVGWVGRLLASDSSLPCACSFSDAPPSAWSLLRAGLLLGGLGFAWADATTAETFASLAVGAAVGGAVFVLPEALVWPEASRAQLARMESHQPLPASRP